MVRRRQSHILQVILEKVQNGQYRLSDHALVEMDDENVLEGDVHFGIQHGRLIKKLTRDPRGLRYVIQGPTMDGREIQVVCRIVAERVRIITVYLVE